MSESRRIGIFGGSFDPIHTGHILIAQDAAEAMKLDRVIFIPASQAPLRNGPPRASAAARTEMVRLAVAGDRRFEVSEIETEKEGVSYSVDTLQEIAARQPTAKLFWIIGTDQAAKLQYWRRFDELARLTEFICMGRGDDSKAAPLEAPPAILHWPKSRRIDISSTEIRARLAAGLETKYFLPSPVYDYIKGRNLYD